ncbi:ubiquitin-protein ligase E3, partial [Galdieria sulphuraria]
MANGRPEVSDLLNGVNRSRVSVVSLSNSFDDTLHPMASFEQVERDMMRRDVEYSHSDRLSSLERLEILSSRSITGDDSSFSIFGGFLSDERNNRRLQTVLSNLSLNACGYGDGIYPRRIIPDPVNFLGLNRANRKDSTNSDRKVGSVIRSRWFTSSVGNGVNEDVPDVDVAPVGLTKSFCVTAFTILRELFRIKENASSAEKSSEHVKGEGSHSEAAIDNQENSAAMEGLEENIGSMEESNEGENIILSTDDNNYNSLVSSLSDPNRPNEMEGVVTETREEHSQGLEEDGTSQLSTRRELSTTPQLPGGLTVDAPANEDPAIIEAAIRNTGIDPTFLAALPEDERAEILASHIAQLATRNTASEAQTMDENVSSLNEEFLAALPPEIRREVVEQEAEYRRRREREQELGAESSAEGNYNGSDLDNASFLATLSPALREDILATADETFLSTLPPSMVAEARMIRERSFRRGRHMSSLEELTSGGISGSRQSSSSNRNRYGEHREGLLIALAKGDSNVEDPREGYPVFSVDALYALVNLFLRSSSEMKQKLFYVIVSSCSHRDIRQRLSKILLCILSPSLIVQDGNENPEQYLAPDIRQSMQSDPVYYTKIVLDLLTGLVSRDDRMASCFLQCCGKEASSQPVFVALVNLLTSPFFQENITLAQNLVSLLNTVIYHAPFLLGSKKVEQTPLTENDSASEDSDRSSPSRTSEQPSHETTNVSQSNPSNDKMTDTVTDYLSSLDFCVSPQVMSQLIQLFPPDTFTEKMFHRVFVLIEVLCKWSKTNQMNALDTLSLATCDLGKMVTNRLRQIVNNIEKRMEDDKKIDDILEEFADSRSTEELQLVRIVRSFSSLIRQLKEEKETAKRAEEAKVHLLRELKPLWDALSDMLKYLEASFSDGRSQTKLAAKQQKNNLLEVVKTLRENRSGRHNLQPSLARIWPVMETFLIAHDDVKEDKGEPTPSADLYDGKKRSAEEVELMKFLEQHQESFNGILRTKPMLLERNFRAALQFPQFIDFDNKKAYFRSLLKKKYSSNRSSIRIHVRREQVFEDSYHQLRLRTPEEMRGQLHVQFVGEEGIDAGGVTREWYTILARKIFDLNYALFIKSAGKSSTFQPNPLSYVNEDHLGFFKFVGRIIGKAIFDGQILDAYFTRSFYKHMLGIKPNYHDLEALDPDYYKSLQWILENDITGLLDLTMSAEIDEFGTTKVVDLIPNGRYIPVTEENKVEYVKLVTDLRMTRSIQHQINSFLEGFHELIAQEDIRVFNEIELELLMSGLPDIDIADLKANIEYSGYTASSPQIQWFWQAVSEMSKEDHARLIMFITGTSKVPLEGFGALQGMDGPQRLQIHRVPGDSLRLPSSHTCFNHLDLPEYDSYEKLKERLLTAIREGGEGFGFG